MTHPYRNSIHCCLCRSFRQEFTGQLWASLPQSTDRICSKQQHPSVSFSIQMQNSKQLKTCLITPFNRTTALLVSSEWSFVDTKRISQLLKCLSHSSTLPTMPFLRSSYHKQRPIREPWHCSRGPLKSKISGDPFQILLIDLLISNCPAMTHSATTEHYSNTTTNLHVVDWTYLIWLSLNKSNNVIMIMQYKQTTLPYTC